MSSRTRATYLAHRILLIKLSALQLLLDWIMAFGVNHVVT